MIHPTTMRTGKAFAGIVLHAAIAAMFASPALAFELPEVNPDLEMRWDNTFRYNLGGRV